MKRFSKIAMFSLAAFTALGAAEAADKKEAAGPPDLGRAVRQSLENLSYYGVFDILSYQMGENGAVELSGYVFNNTLKDDAEDAVLKVPGVKTVVNRIEELDWGVQDDEMLMALPPEQLAGAIAGMEQLGKNGFRYPFPQYGIQQDVRSGMAVSYPDRAR